MKYLVLRSFRSFGKTLTKGTVVDAADIRSPRLRQAEGKIVPAVSSSQVPVEFAAEEPAPQATLEDGNTKTKLVLSFKKAQ
jgi:hypothetical protein